MSPSSHRLTAAAAAGTGVLLALAGSGLAASAVSSALAEPAVVQPAVVQPAVATATATPTTCAGTTSRTPLTPGALVQYDTFEAGSQLDRWTFPSEQTPSVTAEAAHSGAAGLRVRGVRSSPLGYHVTSASTAGAYRVQLWVRPSPDVSLPTRPYVTAVAKDDATGSTLAAQTFVLATDWTQVSLVVSPSLVQGACSTGPGASSFTVLFEVMAPGCGTTPVVSIDLDDVFVSYAGAVTSTASTASTAEAAPGRVVPACLPPSTTTKPPTTTTTSTAPTSTPPQTKAVCKVRATSVMSWDGGAQVQVLVTNLTPVALSGWTLSAKVPSGESVAYSWPGSFAQVDGVVTLKPGGGYGDPLKPRSPVRFGLVVAGGSVLPSGWAVNGTACKAG